TAANAFLADNPHCILIFSRVNPQTPLFFTVKMRNVRSRTITGGTTSTDGDAGCAGASPTYVNLGLLEIIFVKLLCVIFVDIHVIICNL
ncbi:hypothetical protein Tco_0851707, partial [Tanacetum coccineum]